MGARVAAAQDGRELWLHGKDLELGPARPEHLADRRDVPAGADAGEDVVQALGEVACDFLGRRPLVDLEVRRVVELHRQPRVGGFGHDLAGLRDGALHAELARRQLEGRAVGGHQLASLDGEGLGHDEDQLVALDGGDEGEPDAGVARSRLDDDAARLEDAALLRVFDHRQRDAVLDRAARVLTFELHPDLDSRVEELVDAELGGVADGLQNVVCLCHGDLLWWDWGARRSTLRPTPDGSDETDRVS